MFQPLNDHSLFAQLQARFPSSSLITELVQIHGDQFIVRALVQVGGITLATGMAAAQSIEQAEDQARSRALSVLGIGVSPVPPHPPVQSFANGPSLTANPVFSPPPSPSTLSAEPPVTTSSPISTILPVSTVPAEAPMPEMNGQSSNFGAQSKIEPAVEAKDGFLFEPTTAKPTIAMMAESMTGRMDDSLGGVSNDESVAPDPSWFEQPEAVVKPEKSAKPAKPIKAEKSGKPKAAKSTETGGSPGVNAAGEINSSLETFQAAAGMELGETDRPETVGDLEQAIAAPFDDFEDLSSLIVLTDVEMDRVGWTKQEGREYLKRTYRKSTRQKLDVDELMDFLNYLRALPSLHGI